MAHELNTQSPWGKTLISSLSALTEDSFNEEIVSANALIEQILCLLSLTANQSKPAPSTYKRDTLERLRAFMYENLTDPHFTPAQLACIAGLSRRSLYSTFASAGTSFRQELRTMRLEKARGYLDRACFDKRTVAEISQMVGYSSTGLFITRFRESFGITPESYRRTRQS